MSDADDLVAARHRQVVDAGVEERRPDVVERERRGTVRSGRVRIGVTGASGPEVVGEHAVAEVAVGDDPRRVAAHEDRRDPLVAHDPRRVADRRVGVDPDRRPERELPRSPERSERKSVTGECARLALSRAARPSAKCPANCASARSFRKASAGIR